MILTTGLTRCARFSRVTLEVVADLFKNWTNGKIKLYLIWKALQLRKTLGELFTNGDFLPAEVFGEHAKNVTAFFRTAKDSVALIVAPKWLADSRH